MTLQIGLGIGRLVFRALNAAETAFAAVIIVTLAAHRPPAATITAFAVAVAALAAQLLAVRPKLTQRSDAVLSATAGAAATTRSRALRVRRPGGVKVVALLVGGILLFAS